jgi:hypothetical protein
MSETIPGGIHVVRVKMTDHVVGGIPAIQLWVAAVPREEAVAAVQRAIPADWTAELTTHQLAPDHVARLKLCRGDVRVLSSAT